MGHMTARNWNRWIVSFLLMAGAMSWARPDEKAISNVSDFYSATSPTRGIQEAIDALPKGGGMVIIPPGTYLLKRSIRLRDNVMLQGSGPMTILKKCGQVMSPLMESASAGQTNIRVKDGSGFEVGMEIGIKDNSFGGWNITHAIITRIDGHTISLDGAIKKPASVENRAIAVNYFPCIWLQRIRNVSICQLTIDGNISENEGPISDFTFAAIHVVNSSNVRIRDCTVREWPSDGIGVQGGKDAFVSNCNAQGCRGHGFHPGTGLKNAVFTGNMGSGNRGDGLYFCMNVMHCVVSNSVFVENGKNGIGGLGGGGDEHNIVSSNVCAGNGAHGIDAVSGKNNLIANNVCLNNGRPKPGVASGIRIHDTTNTLIVGNRCYDNQDKPTQQHGIVESGKSNFNLFNGNSCIGNIAEGIAIVGKDSIKQVNLE